MARDYVKTPKRPAQRGSAVRRGPPSRAAATRQGVPGWLWMGAGLAIGLFVAVLVYIGKGARPIATPGVGASPTREAAPAIIIPPKQPSRFSFYELLPSYEVVIPSSDARAAVKAGKPTTPDIAAPGQYLIQVGAYKTSAEADRDKARLALLGVESRIEQVTIDQTQTWYRVRIGPESSLAQAQEIVDRLDGDGIKGALVKVKTDAKP